MPPVEPALRECRNALYNILLFRPGAGYEFWFRILDPQSSWRSGSGKAYCRDRMNISAKSRFSLTGLLLLAVLAGLAVRLWTLQEKALTINEISYWMPVIEAGGAHDLLENRLSVTHNHSPGYLFIPYLVKRAGGSLTAMRLTSLFFGLVSIPVTFFFVRKYFSKRIALSVTFLLAVSPFHSYYSVDLSPYALFYLLAILALLALCRGLETGRTGYFALVVPLNIACLAVHYSTLALVAVQATAGLIFLVLRRNGLDRKVIIVKHLNALIAFSVLCLPWLPRFRETLGHTRASLAVDRLAHFDPSYAIQSPVELFRLIGGIPMPVWFSGFLLAALFFSGCIRVLNRKETGALLFCLFALCSPLVEATKVVPLLLSSGGYLLILRLFLFTFPLLWGVSLWFIEDLAERGSPRVSALVAPGRFIVPGLFAMLSFWSILTVNNDFSEKDIRKGFDYVLNRAVEGDAIIIAPHFMIDAFDYYIPISERNVGKQRKTQWRRISVPGKEAGFITSGNPDPAIGPVEKYMAIVDLPGLKGSLENYGWSLFSSSAWLLEFRQSVLGRETFASPACLEIEKELDSILISADRLDFNGINIRKYSIRHEAVDWPDGKLVVNCFPFSELTLFSPYFIGGYTNGEVMHDGEYRFRTLVPDGTGEVLVSVGTLKPSSEPAVLERMHLTVNGKPAPLSMVVREFSNRGDVFRSVRPVQVQNGEINLLLKLDELSSCCRGIRVIVLEIPRTRNGA